jgi:hypothetical protein
VVTHSSRIFSQARSETTSGCSAKGSKLNHGPFAGIDIPGQMIEQLALFQAEQA